MTEPVFGLTFIRDNTEPRPVVPSDMSVVGIVLPSDDADASVFPLQTLVEFNSNDITYLSKLGSGPAFKAVAAINRQLADLQVAARIVIGRVATGLTTAETIANIIGSQAAGTGIYMLLQAGQRLGVIPRILNFNGFTGYFVRASGGATAVTSSAKAGGNVGNGTVTLGGPAYLAGVQLGTYKLRCKGGGLAATSAAKAGGNTGNGALTGLTVDAGAKKGVWKVRIVLAAVNGGTFIVTDPDGANFGGGTVGAAFTTGTGVNFTLNDGATDFIADDGFDITVVDAVPANGGVFTVQRPDGSFGPDATVAVAYSSQVAFTLNDGATDYAIGDGFDLVVTGTAGSALANPLCAALPAVCSALLAHAVVGGPGTSKQDAIDWRETINSDRLIPVDNWHEVATPGNFVDGAADVVGIGVATDFRNGGIPSTSWANQPVQGIIGLKRYDGFSLTDGATDAQILLANNVGVTVRGELGVETAIASSGFVFVGTDNAGDDELWRFYNVTRMRDYIHLLALKLWRKRLGRTNITLHGVQAVENDLITALSDLKSAPEQHIIDFRVGFEADKNSPENIRLGKIRIFFAAEEPSPLRHITADSRRYRAALDTLISDLATQSNTLIAAAA